MSNEWDFGIQIWARSLGQRQRRRYEFRCILSATMLLTMVESVTGVRYVDRECARNTQVSGDNFQGA